MEIKRYIYTLTGIFVLSLSSFNLYTHESKFQASKMPQRTYSNTLDIQLKELVNDSMMIFLRESRENLKNDPYRPIYHLSSPESILHDPNGLCYWNGRWHLFYQYIPSKDYRQHWGHAVSDDLINWKDLPIAIFPDPERMVYSGGTYVEEDRVIAMYNGVGIGTMIAVSDDPLLLNWEKIAIPAIPNTGDANIWKEGDTYYSTVGGRRAPTGPGGLMMRENILYSSKDLKNWERHHEFMVNERFTLPGDDGACPYFWPIGDKYIFFIYSHMTSGQYFIGDYDKEKQLFYPTKHGRANFMSFLPGGVHAPTAYPDGNGGVIAMFNMHQGKRTPGWRGITTLPRRFTLIDDKLKIEPWGDFQSLRYNHKSVKNLKLSANNEILLSNLEGNAYELFLEIDINESPLIELNVLSSPNKEEYTSIKFFEDRGFPLERLDREMRGRNQSLISVETAHSSILPEARSRAPEVAPVILDENETLKLHVFVDKSVVEVFVNNKQAVSVRVYPGREDSNKIFIKSQGKDAEIIKIDFWQMQSIYDELQNNF